MLTTDYVIHYASISFLILSGVVGTVLGQSRISKKSLAAVERQPVAKNDLVKTSTLSLAFGETAAVLALIISLWLLAVSLPGKASGLAVLGAATALALPAFFVGYYSSFPAESALMAIARQPFFSKKIENSMILGLSLLQTPLVFGFITSIIITQALSTIETVAQGLACTAVGLCMGLGSIGSIIGLSSISSTLYSSLAVNKNAYSKLWSFSTISMALIETAALFAFLVALLMLRKAVLPTITLYQSALFILIALLIFLATLSVAYFSAKTACSATEAIAATPEHATKISRACFLAQSLIETLLIYAVLTAFLLLN